MRGQYPAFADPQICHLGLNGQDPSDNDRVALVVDARGLRRGIGGEAFIQQLTGALAELDREKVSYQILFWMRRPMS